MFNRRQILGACSAAVTAPLLQMHAADAQTIAQPARLVVGFQAGGSLDTIARMLAGQMTTWAPSLIVDNKAGAAGRIAMDAVKASAPDGATMILTPAANVVLYPHIYKKLSYDPVADFTPITSVASVGFDIAIGPKVPDSVRTLADFVAWCKANPDKAAYGSPGAGSGHQFVGQMFARAAGITLVHVPYRGAAPAVQDLLAGQIAANISVGLHIPLYRDGKLRILATAGTERSPFLPDVPTFREAGYDVVAGDWFGILAPAGLPPAMIAALNSAVRTAIKAQPTQDLLARLGNTPRGESAEEFAATIKADLARWGEIVKAVGFTPEE